MNENDTNLWNTGRYAHGDHLQSQQQHLQQHHHHGVNAKEFGSVEVGKSRRQQSQYASATPLEQFTSAPGGTFERHFSSAGMQTQDQRLDELARSKGGRQEDQYASSTPLGEITGAKSSRFDPSYSSAGLQQQALHQPHYHGENKDYLSSSRPLGEITNAKSSRFETPYLSSGLQQQDLHARHEDHLSPSRPLDEFTNTSARASLRDRDLYHDEREYQKYNSRPGNFSDERSPRSYEVGVKKGSGLGQFTSMHQSPRPYEDWQSDLGEFEHPPPLSNWEDRVQQARLFKGERLRLSEHVSEEALKHLEVNPGQLRERRQIPRERMGGLVDRRTSMGLREDVSQSSLDNLEMRVTNFRETKALQAALQNQDNEIKRLKHLNRQLTMQTNRAEAMLRSRNQEMDQEKKKLSGKTDFLEQKLKSLERQMNKDSRTKDRKLHEYDKTIYKRDSQIVRLKTEIEALQNRLEMSEEIMNSASLKEKQLRQANDRLTGEVRDLEARLLGYDAGFQKAKKREEELEFKLAELIEQRDRANDLAAQARTSAEKAHAALDREKLHIEALQDEYRKSMQAKEELAKSTSSNTKMITDNDRQKLQDFQNEVQLAKDQLREMAKALEDKNNRIKSLQAELKSAKEQLKEQGNSSNQLSKAEWDRVDIEQQLWNLQKEKAVTDEELEEDRERIRCLEERIRETDEENVQLQTENHKLLEEIAGLETDLEQTKETLQIVSNDSNQQENQLLLQRVCVMVSTYVRTVDFLLNMLEAYMDSKLIDLNTMLDEVEEYPDKTFSAQDVQNLMQSLQTSKENVLEIRSRIANDYAKDLGNDCRVQ